jgi:hypothetical protein
MLKIGVIVALTYVLLMLTMAAIAYWRFFSEERGRLVAWLREASGMRARGWRRRMIL